MEWWVTDQQQPNRLLEACPMLEDKCEIILNETQKIPINSMDNFDAIVLNGVSEPLLQNSYPDNILVFFYTIESNFNSNIRLENNNDIFVSYWSGADIVIPYGAWTYFNPGIRHQQFPERNFAAGKTKLVATFLSNCDAFNGRNEYIRLLQKYIQVNYFDAI